MKKINIFELIITLGIVILSAFGITNAVRNRIIKDSGQISSENYADYLAFSTQTYEGRGSQIAMTYKLEVAAGSISYYEITDLAVTYKLSADHAPLCTYYETLDSISPKAYEILDSRDMTFDYRGEDENEWRHDKRKITFKLIDISGHYSYSLQ